MTKPIENLDNFGEPRPSRSLVVLINGTYFGLLVLSCVALLSVVLVGGASVLYGLGVTVGKAVTSLTLALPIYLVIRYFTAAGSRLTRRGKLNALCLVTVAVWGLQLALFALLRDFIAEPTANSGVRPRTQVSQPPNETTVPRLADGSVDWSQFTPIERAGNGAGAPGADLPECKNHFDQFDSTQPKCRPKQ